MKPTLALAADHRGFGLKKKIIELLRQKGIRVLDFGTDSEKSCDYPDYILKAAEAVKGGKADQAIAVCHSGIGSAIVANKVKGIRAALVHNVKEAELARAHNDANMLVLGAGFVKPSAAKKIVQIWLTTNFEGGRHARRVNKIIRYENGKQIFFSSAKNRS